MAAHRLLQLKLLGLKSQLNLTCLQLLGRNVVSLAANFPALPGSSSNQAEHGSALPAITEDHGIPVPQGAVQVQAAQEHIGEPLNPASSLTTRASAEVPPVPMSDSPQCNATVCLHQNRDAALKPLASPISLQLKLPCASSAITNFVELSGC